MSSKRNAFNNSKRGNWYGAISVLIWILLVPLKLLEAIGFFWLIDSLQVYFSRNRKLSNREISELKKVFGNHINYSKVRVKENSLFASWGAKNVGQKNIGFVFLNVIRFSRKIDTSTERDMDWLVHEIAHVFQYRTIGVDYIFEALRAQRVGGYGYKGEVGLSDARSSQDFNLEQQAEIAKHYYQKIRNNEELTLHEKFVSEMLSGRI